MCEFNLNESQSKPRGFGRKKKVRWVRTSAGGPPVRRFDGMCFIKLIGGRTDRSFGTAPFPRFLFYRRSVRQVRQLAPGLIVRYIKRHLQTAGLGETSAASVLAAPLQQMMLHQRDAHTSKRRDTLFRCASCFGRTCTWSMIAISRLSHTNIVLWAENIVNRQIKGIILLEMNILSWITFQNNVIVFHKKHNNNSS